MKGQPLAYNKDNQEDKEPLFDTVDTLKDTLRIFAEMVGGITVKPEAMESAALRGYATATDLADYLVKKGLPFRDAHETVAHAVKAAISHKVDLSELPLAVLQTFNPKIEKDVYDVLSLRGSLNARNILGGTAPAQVRTADRPASRAAGLRSPWRRARMPAVSRFVPNCKNVVLKFGIRFAHCKLAALPSARATQPRIPWNNPPASSSS